MKRLLAALVVVLPAIARADVHKHGGSPDPVPHEKYVRVVSEADSPLQQTYVKSKDGAYVAAAIRKPMGDGPFPRSSSSTARPAAAAWSRNEHRAAAADASARAPAAELVPERVASSDT